MIQKSILLMMSIMLLTFISCGENSYKENWCYENSGFLINCISGDYSYEGIGDISENYTWTPVIYTIYIKNASFDDEKYLVGKFPGNLVMLPTEGGIFIIQVTSKELANYIDYSEYGCKTGNIYIWYVNNENKKLALIYNESLQLNDDWLYDAVIHKGKVYLLFNSYITVYDANSSDYSILLKYDGKFANYFNNNHSFIYGNALWVSTYEGKIMAVDLVNGSYSVLEITTYSYDDKYLDYSGKYGFIVHDDFLYYWDSNKEAMMSFCISTGIKRLIDDNKWGFENVDELGLTIRRYNPDWITTGGDWNMDEYINDYVLYQDLFFIG